MLDIVREANDFESELKALMHDFHENPELGFNEYRTSKIVYDYLKKLNLEVKNIARTGVVGILEGQFGKEGKTVLLRANMDGLPMDEHTELPYSSKNEGVMHAAGHDAQMAMLLVAAKILTRHKDEFKGNIKFVFQPNEEEAGALDMIDAGVLEAPKVDAAFALDFWNELSSNDVGLSSGPVLGTTEEFEISVFGKAANTSAPHKGRDAIMAAAKIIEALQILETREYDPLNPITIMIGQIKGGKARNMISDYVKLGGTIRFLFPDEQESKAKVVASLKRVIKSVCDMCMVDYDLVFIPSNPSLINDPTLVKTLRKCIKETYGSSDVIREFKSLVGEDFAEISQRIPSAMVFLGVHNPEKGIIYPLYHPKFMIDEDVMKYGVQLLVRSALMVLEE